ncbi:MAG: uracil-DNA glycosylase family protein [Candidatus Bipolaricaulota bacterium]
MVRVHRFDFIADAERRVLACRKCPGLNRHRTWAAPMWGGRGARILFVGQSMHGFFLFTPKGKPDLQVPFLSPSGKPMSAVFKALGWPEIAAGRAPAGCPYAITNLVHCHPPDTRTGDVKERPEEIGNCGEHIEREILALRELSAVIAVGSRARDALSIRYGRGKVPKKGVSFTRIRVSGKDLWFGHMLHPAAALRNGEEAVARWRALAYLQITRMMKFVETYPGGRHLPVSVAPERRVPGGRIPAGATACRLTAH